MATKKSTKSSKTTKVRATASRPRKQTVKKSAFMTTGPGVQPLYWLVFGAVVIFFAIWILKLQTDISSLYDNVNAHQSM